MKTHSRTPRLHRLSLVTLWLICGALTACSGTNSSDEAIQLGHTSNGSVVRAVATTVSAPDACNDYIAAGSTLEGLELLASQLASVDSDAPTEAMAALIIEAESLDQSNATAVVAFFSAVPDVANDYAVAHDDACGTVLEQLLTRGQQLGLS